MILINLQNASPVDIKRTIGRVAARRFRANNLEHVRTRDRARAKAKKPQKLAALRRFLRRRTDEHSKTKMKPCMDCGGRFPTCAMDFDHREGEAKVAGPSQLMVRRRGMFEAEIAKCDLVCANCHRIRTWKRKGSPTAEQWWTE